jgi:hypothetical protein
MKIRFLTWLPLLLVVIIVLYLFIRTDYDNQLPQRNNASNRSNFNLAPRFAVIPEDRLAADFPYKAYLDSANYQSLQAIRTDLALMDTLYKDDSKCREVLSETLTNRLKEKVDPALQQYRPDSLLQLVQWAERFQNYAEADRPNAVFHKSIATFWLTYVSNKLAAYAKNKSSLKYDFKYKYLVGRCYELKYSTPVIVTKMEKVINNLIGSKWGHLTDASWNQASWLQKIVFLILVLITLYAYYLLIKKITSRIMKKKITAVLLLALTCSFAAEAQYDSRYAETKTLQIKGETYAIQKMLRKDNRIKVKYFAARENNTTVYDRFREWSANKRIVAYSSGTYMDDCNGYLAKPVGLCIDNGNIVNNSLSDKLDGLAIVYATGGMAATNLRSGNLNITYPDNTKKTVDILGNATQRIEFVDWAENQEATVFQAHLFVYNNQLKIGTNSSQQLASRRFLAVCKEGADVIHYIINLPNAATLYDGTVKAYNYLKEYEEVDVTFMINLDTGCQDVLKVFDSAGKESNSSYFTGRTSISNAANLLVYYYE